jgi:hypothetical protein
MALIEFWTPPSVLHLTRGGGGVRNTAPPKKNHFSKKFPIFVCFTTSSSKSIFGQTEMDFKNSREVFSHHGMRNKNLFQFLQRSYDQGESKTSSRPIFSDFQFSVSVSILQELLRPYGNEFGETEGGFCPEHAHIQ